jgi:hypothetical protein
MKVMFLVTHDVDEEDVTDRVKGDIFAGALTTYLDESEVDNVEVDFIKFLP